MIVFVVAIVEGHTERTSFERLLQRIWHELGRPERLQVLEGVRAPRSSLIHPNGVALCEAIENVAIQLCPHLRHNPGCQSLILIDIDAERDCPAQLGPRLVAAANAARADLTIACVLAKRMFENWIVAGASTLGGVLNLPDPLPARTDVEAMNGSTWLDTQLRSVTPNSKYKKADHAIEFVKAMNLPEARSTSPSFARLCKKLECIPRCPPLSINESGT